MAERARGMVEGEMLFIPLAYSFNPHCFFPLT